MFKSKTYVIVVLIFWNAAAAFSQERVWNAALDWYESVCEKCAVWMERIDRGESVPKDSLQMMLRELTAVRQNLQGVWGQMSSGQRLRFEVIRARFASGRWHKESLSSLPSLPAVQNTIPLAAKALQSTEPSGYKAFPLYKPVPPRIRPGVIAGLTSGVYPDFSVGALLGLTFGDWCLFAKGRGSSLAHEPEYDCLSDGAANGSYFWSGGEEATSRLQITLDAAYRVWQPLSLYAGVGYGRRTLCWKDYNGSWARVTDRTYSGLALDAGILLHPVSQGPASGLTLLLGCGLVSGGYLDAEVALCWRF